MAKVILRENPVLFDKVIADIQKGLAEALPWLDHAFGRAERLVKIINGKKIYSPNVYVGGNEYELITPDSNFGNYSFVVLGEPQEVDWNPGDVTMKTPFSLIVWVDMRTINDTRDTEAVKAQIVGALNRILIHHGMMSINTVYERAENVYKGFTLDEVDNQFMMHPYAGWRFEGVLKISECV